MTNNNKYNGWTNYETWNCNLWFDDCFTEQAQEIYDSCEGDEDEAINELAKYIEDYVEEFAPKLENGFFSDVLQAAINSVNWYEIAENYIADVEKTEEQEVA